VLHQELRAQIGSLILPNRGTDNQPESPAGQRLFKPKSRIGITPLVAAAVFGKLSNAINTTRYFQVNLAPQNKSSISRMNQSAKRKRN
jgi:hypothetical protein